MTNEEKAIARAIAEHLGMRGGKLATDVGSVEPYLPPHRANGNELRVKLAHQQLGATYAEEDYDVRVIVAKRTGYIG
jgi:hypothetical protein